MALQIEWTDKAYSQLVEILSYWEERNGNIIFSKKLYDVFQKTLTLLSKYPESGRQTENLFIKKKNSKDYYIYYSHDSSNLTVIGISYAGRDPKYLKKLIA